MSQKRISFIFNEFFNLNIYLRGFYMLATTYTLVIGGIDAQPVTVEVDLQAGLPAFDIVGLASASIKEARERVRSAIKNSGYRFPNSKIVVNLAPADMKKEGSHFDLAIAIGILIASEQIESVRKPTHFFAGELSLDGSLRSIPGILPMAMELQKSNPDCYFIVPEQNSREAGLVTELYSLTANSLHEVSLYLQGLQELSPSENLPFSSLYSESDIPDFAEVRGQETAKRALQVAAAGLHNILFIGPPGGGKTMLARRVSGILPEMSRDEVLETTRIYSVAGLLNSERPLIAQHPFRAPHKNASSASIIGGGKMARPGEISLAQNGVLFLDEFPEFNRDVLEALRQPLEDKVVTVARAQATHTYPAHFSLIASMNPCPCGFYGSDVECSCTPLQIQRYLSRISGPLMDRMDLQVEVPRVKFEHLQTKSSGENSASIRQKVTAAREIQKKRFARSKTTLNSQMKPAEVQKYCQLTEDSSQMLKTAFERFNMSARSYDRILKVARTIADLEGSETIQFPHLAEALQYRSLDRKYWQV